MLPEAAYNGPGGAIATQPLPVVSPLTSFESMGVPYGQSQNVTPNKGCSCRKPGPRRKCLERAAVVYKGGRRKGKAAGTKCIRYAN